MTDTPEASMSTERVLQFAVGLVLLVVAGVAGGSIAGFKVEPQECDECGRKLAACEARDELIREALSDAKIAIKKLEDECP